MSPELVVLGFILAAAAAFALALLWAAVKR